MTDSEVRGGVTYGNVTEDGQQDVDEEVGIASALEEHANRWEEDGEHDLDEVAGGERHGGGMWCWFEVGL
jgi:hypothetical protein